MWVSTDCGSSATAVACRRFLDPPQWKQRAAQIHVIDRLARRACERLPDQVQGERVPAGLQGDHPKQIRAVGVARRGGENFPIAFSARSRSPA
jgi:hypothetical protein